MIEVMRVRANVKALADTIIQAKAKDAQLMFCLAYLIARSLGEGVMRIEDAAAKVRVSVYTYQKWIRKLAKMGLIRFAEGSPHVWSIEIGDVPTLDPKRTIGHPCAKSKVKVRRGKNATAKRPAVTTTATTTGTESRGENATVPPPTTPSTTLTISIEQGGVVESSSKNAMSLLTISEKSRYDQALITYESTVNMKSRGKIATALVEIVKNPLFKSLNLVDEIQNADAWLTQSKRPYKDMTRYLTNWLRTAANGATRRKPQNANSAPTNGKYDTVQKSEAPKQEAPVGLVWPE